MIETLTISPMATGTRSRRAGLLRRNGLGKSNNDTSTASRQQRPLEPAEPRLTRTSQQGTHAPRPSAHPLNDHPPQRPQRHHHYEYQQQQPVRTSDTSLPSPAQQQYARPPEKQKQQKQNQSQNQQKSFPLAAAATRSAQNILNNASSGNRALRPKRKPDAEVLLDSDAEMDAAADAVVHKRARLETPAAPAPPSAAFSAPRPLSAAKLPNPKPLTIPPQQPPPPSRSTATITNSTTTSSAPVHAATTARHSARHVNNHAVVNASVAATTTTTTISSISTPSPVGIVPSSSKTTSQLALKQKEKAANGFKQELKGLQVSPATAVAAAAAPDQGGRKLRSAEASRFKSELSAYFPEYDEVIGNDPREEHLLNVDTPILLVQSSAAHPTTDGLTTVSGPPVTRAAQHAHRAVQYPIRGYGDALFYDLFDSHVVDFGFLGHQTKAKRSEDPLPDTYFEQHHKRAARLERSIRNSEKGRAQHEKDQIIRLLEGLQGPDWLRVMGVSGITDSKKKAFEPARAHFIHGCRSILEKFRLWSLEEKRRKQEKDRAHAEELKAQKAAAKQQQKAARSGRSRGKTAAAAKHATKSRRHSDHVEDSECADDDDSVSIQQSVSTLEDQDDDESNVDAVIAKQLRREVMSRSRLAPQANSQPNKRRKVQQQKKSSSSSSSAKAESASVSPPKDAKLRSQSFHKRSQREAVATSAAASRSRRKGTAAQDPHDAYLDYPDKDVVPEPATQTRRTRGGMQTRGGGKK